MDYEDIARAIVEEAVAADAAETATFGERRGDELPECLSAFEPAPTLDQGEGRAPSARLGQLGLGLAA